MQRSGFGSVSDQTRNFRIQTRAKIPHSSGSQIRFATLQVIARKGGGGCIPTSCKNTFRLSELGGKKVNGLNLYMYIKLVEACGVGGTGKNERGKGQSGVHKRLPL